MKQYKITCDYQLLLSLSFLFPDLTTDTYNLTSANTYDMIHSIVSHDAVKIFTSRSLAHCAVTCRNSHGTTYDSCKRFKYFKGKKYDNCHLYVTT